MLRISKTIATTECDLVLVLFSPYKSEEHLHCEQVLVHLLNFTSTRSFLLFPGMGSPPKEKVSSEIPVTHIAG